MSPTETQEANVQQLSTSSELPSDDISEFDGVRGWLLLFCISLTILNPILRLTEAAKSKNVLTVLVDLGLTALGMYTGIGLWRRKAKYLEWLGVYFMALLTLAALSLTAFIQSMHGYLEPDLSFNPNLDQGIRAVASVIIWWAYFKKSKRVKATYGRNL